jgi:hypothetical protein
VLRLFVYVKLCRTGFQPSTRGAVTITRTGDKVFEALIASLDDQQKILLRGGYVKLWGDISLGIKAQFEMHLDTELKRGIADHCNQVLGESPA